MDPCSRLLSLNHTVEPWGDKDMRWAINYAIDRDEMVRDAYQGTTLPSKHFFPAYPPLNRYVELLEDAGLYEEYPLMTHDPQRARQIIQEQGWSMGSAGYYQRDGEQLSLDIQVHASFIEKQRIARVLVDQLQAIGINASMRRVDPDLWLENKERGYYEAVVDWDACGSIHEPWASMSRYHEDWIVPVGERVIGRNNHIRWRNEEYSALTDEIRDLPLGDPRVDALFVEAMGIWLEELPFIPITQAKKLVPFDTTYWTGWPTSRNNYVHPPSWWQSAHLIIHQLEPVEP
jgi:peptide/nickel transport system substrate-binding protein